jgi:hypothetical protein
MTEWKDEERNIIASMLREIAKDAPPIQASWLRELALAIDNS